MWYKVYFNDKVKIIVFVNEIKFVCCFNIVIQSIGSLEQSDIC